MSHEGLSDVPTNPCDVTDELLRQQEHPLAEILGNELSDAPSCGYLPLSNIHFAYATVAAQTWPGSPDFTRRFDAYIDGLRLAKALTGIKPIDDGFEGDGSIDMETRFDSTLAQAEDYLENSEIANERIFQVFEYADKRDANAMHRLFGLKMGLVMAGYTELKARKRGNSIEPTKAARSPGRIVFSSEDPVQGQEDRPDGSFLD